MLGKGNRFAFYIPIIVGLLSAFSIDIYIYMLRFSAPPSIWFHVLYMVTLASSSLVIYCILTRKYRNLKLIFIFLLLILMSLQLISHLRTSENVLEGPDTNYELQIVENMLATGHIDFSIGTGQATAYRFYPGLELMITAISSITGIDPIFVLKFLGVFIGLLAIVFLERFYHSLFKEMRLSIPSAFIAGLSPFLIGMNSFTIHQALALCFFTLFLWSAMKEGMKWKIISFISVFGIIVTHHLTTYILLFFFVLIMIAVIFFKYLLKFQIQKLIRAHAVKLFLSIFIIIIMMTLILSPQIMIRTINQLITDITSNIFSPGSYSLTTISPVGIKPQWMIYLEIMGFVAYGFFIIEYFKGLFKKNKKVLPILIYATVGLVIFSTFLLVWISGLQYAREVQWRGLIYLYYFTAPLFVIFLLNIPSFKLMRKTIKGSNIKIGSIIIVGMLILVSANSVYQGVVPSKYDSASSYSSSDVRLNLEQWQSAGDFARGRDELDYSWGVRLAWEHVGGYGHRIILPLEIDEGSNISSFMEMHPKEYFFLRKSIVQIPDYENYSPSEMEFAHAIGSNDILYTTGEVVLIKANS